MKRIFLKNVPNCTQIIRPQNTYSLQWIWYYHKALLSWLQENTAGRHVQSMSAKSSGGELRARRKSGVDGNFNKNNDHASNLHTNISAHSHLDTKLAHIWIKLQVCLCFLFVFKVYVCFSYSRAANSFTRFTQYWGQTTHVLLNLHVLFKCGQEVWHNTKLVSGLSTPLHFYLKKYKSIHKQMYF